MNAHIPAPVDDTVLTAPHRVEAVGDDVVAALRHVVARHRLRGPVSGAYLVGGPLYSWRPGDGFGLVRLCDDGEWRPVDDIVVPALGDDPIEATRRWCDEHPLYDAIEGYVLDNGILRATCWAWSADGQTLVDPAARRWGVPDGVAYAGLPVRLYASALTADGDPLDLLLSELDLPKRIVNFLFRHSEITTVRELLTLSRSELGRLPGIGLYSLREVDEALADHGLHLPWQSTRSVPAAIPPERARAEPLATLGLSPKSNTTLRDGGVLTVGDLLDRTLADLLRLDGVGDRMATEVRDALRRRGLALAAYDRVHPRPRPIPGDPSVPIDELCTAPGLGYHKTRMLRAAGVETVGDLARMTAEDLLALPKFGGATLRSVRAWMAELGFALKGE